MEPIKRQSAHTDLICSFAERMEGIFPKWFMQRARKQCTMHSRSQTMVRSAITVMKTVIVAPTLTIAMFGRIAQEMYMSCAKLKTNESLDDIVPCPMRAISSKISHKPFDSSEDLGVTVLVVIIERANETLSSKVPQIPLRSPPSNKIWVLQDMGSYGDSSTIKKESPNIFSPWLGKVFAYITWDLLHTRKGKAQKVPHLLPKQRVFSTTWWCRVTGQK